MAQKKGTYDISESSLYDLKAELHRRQADFQQKKQADGRNYTGTSGYQALPSKTKIIDPIDAKKKAQTVKGKNNEAPVEKPNEPSEDERRWEYAKTNLARKAKLYEKMTAGEITSNPEEDDNQLIDFQRKAVEKRHFNPEERRNYSSSSESDHEQSPNFPSSFADSEWTEYEDYLGRTRKCLKKDLVDLLSENNRLAKEMDRANEPSTTVSNDHNQPPQLGTTGQFDFGPSPLQERTLVSSDMEREMDRIRWEREQNNPIRERSEEPELGPAGPVHYQDFESEDNRSLGVGYYRFAGDEQERLEQQARFAQMAKQNEAARNAKEQLKAKREAKKAAQLAKVQERRNLPADSESCKPDLDDEDWDFEKEIAKQKEPEKKLDIYAKPVPMGAREWDTGKEFGKDPEPPKRNPFARKSEERDPDFAPPAIYSSGNKGRRANFPEKNPTFAPPASYSSASPGYSDDSRAKHHSAAFPPPQSYSSVPKRRSSPPPSTASDSDFATPSTYSNQCNQRPGFGGAVRSHDLHEDKPPSSDYKPWEHIQPWKKRQKASSDRTDVSESLSNSGCMVPPPSLYNEGTKMDFNRVTQQELRKHAQDYFK